MAVTVATVHVWLSVAESISAMRALALLLAFSALPTTAHAGWLLDKIHDYDLNDYALGAAVSSTQGIYAGAPDSTFLYPYLTSFQHSAFNDDIILIRDENFGLRMVTQNDWEFGVIARFQTLGSGAMSSDELLDIEDKRWALESGPLIGWRRWPVNLQFRSYWDIPSRHGGTSSELEFSLPFEFDRGFAVPAVKLTYMSDDYADYYFGVSAAEATPARPAYRADAASNVWAGFSMGYELAPRWLLKASLGIEYLDDSISGSPIIERDTQWSGSVGLAYNNDLFVPRDYGDALGSDAIEIRVGAFSSTIDTTIRRSTDGGQPQESVDVEDLLGAADNKTILQVGLNLRAGYYHQVQLSYFGLQRESTKVINNDLIFGDQTYEAGSEVASDIESSLLRVSYGYSLMRDGQKELGVKAGVSYFRFDSLLQDVDSQAASRLETDALLPTFGAFGSVRLGEYWQLGADLNIFALDFHQYDGFMSLLSVELSRKFGDSITAGVGYNLYLLRLSESDLGEEFDIQYRGPKLYAGFTF